MKNQYDLAESWFRKGDDDINAAEVLLRSMTSYGAACFHSQQAIEKYLKGFIEFKGQIAPKVHDLVELNRQCIQSGAVWKIEDEELAQTTRYAVECRYDLNFYPNEYAAKTAFLTAQRICRVVL